ncbi:MAG TPA: tetratricopeptide repeat protein [Xanthobacteraceae bacterium]|nr:tetratricopeptide repeat protein [Xanthobacteraceae bacterium]
MNLPPNVVAELQQAMTHQQRGNLTEARSLYKKVLSAVPEQFEALHFCGLLESQNGNLAEAEMLVRRSLDVNSSRPEAFTNYALVLRSMGRDEDAIIACDKALRLNPRHVDALVLRANALVEIGRGTDAMAELDKALAMQPNSPEVHNSRGHVLHELNRFAESRASYVAALRLRPDPTVHSNLIFALNFDPALTAADHQAERGRWNAMYGSQFSRFIQPHRNDPEPNRRLRIGYVSSHFRHQAATYAFASAILGRDPEKFEVVCYSDTSYGDEVTEKLRAGADRWCSIVGQPDNEVAQKIRMDGIDILVDCVGHMRGHRLLVFAQKPAPIQVTAWGEPTGTGLSAIDFLFADPVLVPANERHLLAEKVYDLPNFLGYWTPEPLPEPGALPAHANGYVTFGSFNRSNKIQDAVLRCWAAILRAVPTARLVLKGHQAQSSQHARVEAVMREEGVDPSRLTLLSRVDRMGHFMAYRDIDIALDPFPHAGGMTTLDALWMGVPVVAASGGTISSRLAAASLTALGLADFVAADSDAYIKLAVAKAHDLQGLADLRGSLRQRISSSAIGDPRLYAAAVESAYREMWRQWCSGRRSS